LGLRHLVAVTPSPEDVCRKGLPRKVSCSDGLRGIAGFTTDAKVLGAAAGHEATIVDLLKVGRVVHSREELKADLETVPAQVLYFLCHVGDHKRNPRLVLGPSGDEGVGYTTLVDLWKPRLCSVRPLVVLNACNSAAPSPERLLSLVRGFLERGAAGAIGTEITVFVSLAAPFGEHFAQSYVNGVALGEAIRRARVAMLAKGNPLGLAYLAFGLPQLELVPDELVPQVPEGSAS
jgi:CHAT domain